MKREITAFAAFSFEAAHYLPHVPKGHKCGRVHGHNWIVEIHVAGDVIKPEGWIVDFYDIERAWREAVYDVLDHRELNMIDGLDNPTTERIAWWIGTRMRTLLPCVSRVVVRETPAFGAIWGSE